MRILCTARTRVALRVFCFTGLAGSVYETSPTWVYAWRLTTENLAGVKQVRTLPMECFKRNEGLVTLYGSAELAAACKEKPREFVRPKGFG